MHGKVKLHMGNGEPEIVQAYFESLTESDKEDKVGEEDGKYLVIVRLIIAVVNLNSQVGLLSEDRDTK
jgi:hypothetical protein